MAISLLLDIGPAVHQGAGLARYAERLAVHLLAHQSSEIDLNLFYNAHSGHKPPAALRNVPALTLPLNQYAWRLSVLASQIAGAPYWPIERLAAKGRWEAETSARSGAKGRTNRAGELRPAQDGAPVPARMPLFHATEHLLPRLVGPTVLTVHDLIFERYPEHHTRRNTWFLRVGMRLFVRAATAIIAVSQHTRDDLIELYGTPAEKIHVVYEGIDPIFAPAPADKVRRVCSRYSPDRPYLLMVGTLEPRKNHAAALRALARLKAAGFPHRLLVAGGRGWLFEPVRAQVNALGLEDDVHFTGYVPLEELPALYTGAECVLLPSLYEGFGFPALEAMACAAPVVCSNASSLPEVCGGAARFAPPMDDAALAAQIALVLTQPVLASRMRAQGQARAASFRWDRCAAETMAVYQAALDRARFQVSQDPQ